MTKKVLLIVNTHVYDDSTVIYTAHSLQKLGYHVQIIGAERKVAGLPMQQVYAGIPVILAPMIISYNPMHWLGAIYRLLRAQIHTTSHPPAHRSNPISLFFFLLWVLRLAWREPLHAIHCFDMSPVPSAVLLGWRHRAKLVVAYRENTPTIQENLTGKLASWLENRLLKYAHVVITTGERLGQELKKRGAKNVVYIGNWKHLSDYQLSPETIAQKRHALNTHAYRLVISYIGTLDPNREIEHLLNAIQQAPDVLLIIGGGGLLHDKVEQAVQHLPNAHWLGWIHMDDIPLYTLCSDAVYYCRTRDTFQAENWIAPAPFKLFEAFAAGRALIATRGVGEIGDFLEKIPAGILIEEVTPPALLHAFEQLKNPQTLAQLQHASAQAGKQYNWDVAENTLKEIYEHL
jgi:glycosyltransferase involved in cell wall biosynthesis